MQTYQELTDAVLKELPYVKGNKQSHFYVQKKLHPKRYERLDYDENGQTPFSKTLESIIFDLKMADLI